MDNNLEPMREKLKTLNEVPTYSNEGGLKYSTTGNEFLDEFASLARYKQPRNYDEVAITCIKLWNINPIDFLKITFYLRMISRAPYVISAGLLDRHVGQGLKAEFRMRMFWLAEHYPETFNKNLEFIIAVGSWNDIFEILGLDLAYNGKKHGFNWINILRFINNGLNDEHQCNLIKKYLPTIRSAKYRKTLQQEINSLIGSTIAKYVFKDTPEHMKYYRQMKSSGTAHEWQQHISKEHYHLINFNKIPGRVLKSLTTINEKGTSFVERHGLLFKFSEWLDSQPVAKFTGYPYELFANCCDSLIQKKLVNKQFELLLQNMDDIPNFIIALDISESMQSKAVGCNMSSYEVGKAMALYYSMHLPGKLKGYFMTFSEEAKLEKFEGETYADMFNNYQASYYGSTNPVSMAYLICKLHRDYEVPEYQMPKGLLCISDGEFERYGNSTTFNKFKQVLSSTFSKEFVDNFKLVLWDIPNSYYGSTEPKFETQASTPNFYQISGFDPAALKFLFNVDSNKQTPKTAEELLNAAMNQELLNMLKV